MDTFFYLLIIINAIGALLMIVDKSRARKKLRRISEINLLTVAIAGGALGEMIGMYLVRHKTKHRKFTIGLPILVVIHALLAICFFLM